METDFERGLIIWSNFMILVNNFAQNLFFFDNFMPNLIIEDFEQDLD